MRVHPDDPRRPAPAGAAGHQDGIWKERLEDIAAHERYLARNGYVIRKFFLHVSQAEQKRRFLARIDTPEKNWKFQMSDVHERQHWKAYMAAYEDAIQRTATPEAPWIVVPADHKWFTRLVVSNAIVDALEGLDLRFPTIDDDPPRRARAGTQAADGRSERRRRERERSGQQTGAARRRTNEKARGVRLGPFSENYSRQ